MKWKFINWTETTKHKFWVMLYLLKACYALIKRGVVHDLSKYSALEAPYFERALPGLRDSEYGTEEYRALLASLRPALEHHYKANSHHPEHYPNGFGDMSPLDLVEMLCDWRAATRRHATGDIRRSVEVNAQRFGYDDGVKGALLRDIAEIHLLP